MNIQPIKPNEPSFGYHHPLKTMFLKGQLPTVKYGLYGGKLTKKTVSLEHIQPVSQGGQTVYDNLALTTKQNNNNRGTEPIRMHLTKENLVRYLTQWIDVVVGNFNGNDYIAGILNKLNKLL